MRPVLREWHYTSWRLDRRHQRKQLVPSTFHSTSRPKRALLWVLASFLVAALPGPNRRACGGASIATGAVQDGERGWRLGEPASKRRRRHQQRSILGSSISKSATASAMRNVAIRGHDHALQRPGSVKQGQRQERLTVRPFTTNPNRLAHVQNPLRGTSIWGRAVGAVLNSHRP